MEKVETKVIQTEEITHNFYCDECGAHLGSSVEWDDGYYQGFGGFELKMHTSRGWYEIKRCFCDTCRDKFLNKVYASLEAAGFELD